VLLALLILYINFMTTSIWSESMFTPLRLHVDDVRKVSPDDQAVIDLVAIEAVWRIPGFEVDSFVHEVRALDRLRGHFHLCYYTGCIA
jgi:hypothetical protein